MVSQILFYKPIICNQNQDYSVLLTSKTLTNCYYAKMEKVILKEKEELILLLKGFKEEVVEVELIQVIFRNFIIISLIRQL